MNTKAISKIFGILLFLAVHHLSTGQCSIENLTIATIDCVNDNNAGLVIDFQSDSPSAVGYQVSTQLGFEVIQYSQLPFTLTVSGNCITDYNLTVTDLALTDCEMTQDIGVICCDVMCNIDLDITDLQCQDDESILVSVDFNVTGTLTDSVDIFTNDDYVSTLAIADGSPFVLPGLGPVQNLVVCEQGTTCCDTVDVVSPCVCNIFDIHTAVTSCDQFMDSYFLRVDFETISPSSDSFNIGRPGNNLGIHAYADLPVRVGPISFDEDDNDIFILDQVDALCFGFIPHITLDSCQAVSCELSDLNVVSTVDCDNSGDVSFQIEFNTSLESDGFQINIDGTTYGPYQYGLNTYNVGPLTSDGLSPSVVTVTDLGDMNCSIDTVVAPISCDCSYDNLSVTQFCNQDVLIAVQLDFDPNGAVNDSFDITSVINTQRYAYSELPITINGLPSEDISLTINDVLNPSCSLTITEELDCVLECSITNFEVELLSCEALSIANLSFTFDYDDLTTDTVVLRYNGDILGNYIIDDVAAYLIPSLEVDCAIDFNSFSLAPINDSDCVAEFAMPNIDCCTECEITNVNPVLTCDPQMFGPIVHYYFEYSGDSLDVYELNVNGHSSEHMYNLAGITGPGVQVAVTNDEDFPIDLIYEITFPLCSFQDTFTVFCAEQCIENIQVDTLTCSDGMFTASLDFDHAETNDSFQLFVNEVIENTYSYDQLPLEIGPYVGDGITNYTFALSLNSFNNCTGTYELGILDCAPNSIDDITINNIRWSSQLDGVRIEGISSFTKISLVDLNGRILQNDNINTDQTLIQKDNLTTGLYFVRLQDENGNIHTIKIIL